MNATVPANLRISYNNTRETLVNCWGFDMLAEFAYEEGEPAIVTGPSDDWHPGSPPNVSLTGCRVGGVQIVEMLRPEQIERIEDAILEQLEA